MLVLLCVEDGAQTDSFQLHVCDTTQLKESEFCRWESETKIGWRRHTWDQNSYEKALIDSQKEVFSTL